MRSVRILTVIAALLAAATSSLAQRAVTSPDLGLQSGTYLQMPVLIPQGGCIWNNAVFSDGAIIEKYEQPRAFFRCVQGSWQSFDSFDAAASGQKANHAPAAQGSERQPQ